MDLSISAFSIQSKEIGKHLQLCCFPFSLCCCCCCCCFVVVPGWTEELPVQPRSSEQRLRGRERLQATTSLFLSSSSGRRRSSSSPTRRSVGWRQPSVLRVSSCRARPVFLSLSHPRNLLVRFSPFSISIRSSIGRIGSIGFDPIIGLKSFPFFCSFAIRSSLARCTVLSVPLRVDRQDLDRSLGWWRFDPCPVSCVSSSSLDLFEITWSWHDRKKSVGGRQIFLSLVAMNLFKKKKKKKKLCPNFSNRGDARKKGKEKGKSKETKWREKRVLGFSR